MNKVQVLDCTLRDGGYCNQWRFGFRNAQRIIAGLTEANVDIIECGFLTKRVCYDCDVTKFPSLEDIIPLLPENRAGKMFVAMANFGELDLDMLPVNDGKILDGIRVAFHKKDRESALKLCADIKAKGYKVFVQAMVSLGYSDEEFLDMIRRVNEFEPYAFYIVDSFGAMKAKDLTRLFYMVEHNLKESIQIGFHSHNNMQLSYSNAQTLINLQTNRNLIIDSSVLGMGRGAGNLNTELFVDYLNENSGGEYDIKPLLTIIDEILNVFYQENYWGYSLPNYLSAAHNAHPNYAGYLNDKNTLTVENMNEIFDMIPVEKRLEFDKNYIEDLYLKYMLAGQKQEMHMAELKEKLYGKKLLLIAPGKSSFDEADKVSAFASEHDVVTVSVNFDYPHTHTDFIFLSNLKRFRDLPEEKQGKCIVTSNIPAENAYLRTKYYDLLNFEEAVSDNAGLMAIQFMMQCGVEEIYLAGMDGYSHDASENYGDSQLALVTKIAVMDKINVGLTKVLRKYAQKVNIHFLTPPKFITLND